MQLGSPRGWQAKEGQEWGAGSVACPPWCRCPSCCQPDTGRAPGLLGGSGGPCLTPPMAPPVMGWGKEAEPGVGHEASCEGWAIWGTGRGPPGAGCGPSLSSPKFPAVSTTAEDMGRWGEGQ